MITRFRKWRARSRVQTIAKYYKTGYDWAAGALLRGDMGFEEMDARIYWNDPITSTMTGDAFDRGAGDALTRCFRLLHPEVSSIEDLPSNLCRSTSEAPR